MVRGACLSIARGFVYTASISSMAREHGMRFGVDHAENLGCTAGLACSIVLAEPRAAGDDVGRAPSSPSAIWARWSMFRRCFCPWYYIKGRSTGITGEDGQTVF